MLLLILCFALIALFYFKVVKVYDHWDKKGIPYIKPVYFFGNFASNVFRIKSLSTIIDESCKKHPNERYFGMYQFRMPTLLIKDPELFKQIAIKDFDSFSEHLAVVPVSVDPLFAKNLFAMSSKDGWHEMRATLSPSFTSSKMRMLFKLMNSCSEQFVNYFKQSNGKVTVELKDSFTRYTCDVIGTAAFGITSDSLTHQDNEFYLMGKEASNFSGIRALKFFCYTLFPAVMKLLKVRVLSDKSEKFIRKIVSETLRIRIEKNIVRPDMIHLLLEARRILEKNTELGINHKKMELSDEDIAAQALIFFLAGFETVATAITFLAYELALNLDVQQNLYEEITTALECNSGQLTYELVTSMKYLDNVLSESLRLHTPVAILDRRVTKPYTIEPINSTEKPLHLEEGSVIWFATSVIHHDEKYYPNPSKFKPERFADKNKHNINPSTYLPFGIGPRNCIGSRFAILEIKLIIIQILQHFEIVPDAKTAIPLKPDKTNFNNLPAEGVFVAFKPRVLT